MFWISKKNVLFEEAWKNGFIDIHNHLLPGIDDGSNSIGTTQNMIVGMQQLGITEAIATPHTYTDMWPNTKKKILETYAHVSHEFVTGCSSEYFVDFTLLDLLNQDSLLPLKDNYLLIEFSITSPPIKALMDVLFALKLKGYRLILAHPERYLYWDKNLIPFEKLKSFGLEFQLNSLSLLGYYGKRCKIITEKLLQEDFYTFLGTDFHNTHHIAYTKNHTFSEKHMQSIMELVTNNHQFSNK